MNKKIIIGIVAVVAVIGLWAAFRPELLFINKTVNESFPAAIKAGASGPQEIEEGKFRGLAHETKGTAALYKSSDGKRTLRFTNFSTSNGPDVHVYLVAANDAPDNSTVQKAGFIDLGSIKGNQGDQNYDVPATVDLDKYKAVSIWCARFNVNFAAAPLSAASQAASDSPTALADGSFTGYAHETEGKATVYRLPDGKNVLRLTEFKTSNGPDVHVYLVAADDAKDNTTVQKAGFLDLGSIKGNEGDQNYDLPASADLNKYRAVTIWCARFNVNFATAPLKKK